MRRSAALLVLWTGLAPLATLLAFTLHSHDRFQAGTAEPLYLRTALLANGISLSRANPLTEDNREALQELLAGMATGRGLTSLRVTDRHGRTLAEARASTNLPLAASGTARNEAAKGAQTDKIQIEGDQVYVWRPIDHGGLGGWVRAGFDIALLGRADSDVWQNAAIFGVVSTTLSLFLLVLLIGRFEHMLARRVQHGS